MIKVKLIGLSLFLFAINSIGVAQSKRSMHWYFGWKAGVDFTSGVPVADTNSAMRSIEGCSSISDTAGHLLFYTGAQTVYNRLHQPMPNGNDLLQDQSSAQASVIVPKPGSDSLYYLFTNSPIYGFGFRYNIIDRSLDNGNGDVLQKNVLLMDDTLSTEELAGTMHCNYRDYWIVVRQSVENNFTFRAYRLGPDGVHDPVVSSFSFPNYRGNTVGCLTFSQDGKKMVFSSFRSDILLFDFDKQTGILTLSSTIPMPNLLTYATALSPDSRKLYVSYWEYPANCNVVQYDLTAGNINNTKVILDTVSYRNGSPNGYGFIGQLRLGPDQKIYVSRWNQEHPYQVDPETFYSLDSLDVINNPNATGLASNFQRNAVYLQKKTTMFGLPNFISNFTNPVMDRSDFCSDIALPVILSGIWAVLKEGKTILKWETLAELNARHFVIERSKDGIHFSKIGITNAAGTTGIVSKYAYTDIAPAKGINYYRIKMVDVDGAMRNSKIVRVQNGSRQQVQVFPNPFSNNINIQINEPGVKVMVEISDVSGRMILLDWFTASNNGLIHLPLTSVPKGIYLLKVIFNGEVSTTKLIK